MKILIDENIPCALELFGQVGNVKLIQGRHITQAELQDADALVVRSVTNVNESLLINSSIKFVGTATSGTDHIDQLWLQKVGIKFYAASGCNAISVVEYVFSALLALSERNNFSLKCRTVGIVGFGNIGRCLKKRLEIFGIRTLLCDPPLVDRGKKGVFYTIDELVEQVDILTFHTPLNKTHPYKTLHLANESLINRLKPGSILINTCRGSVVDNDALLSRLQSKKDLSVILDVWEKEPKINTLLLDKIDIGTAHIAGHSLEGKIRGAIQVFEAYSNFIGKPQKVSIEKFLPKPKIPCISVHGLIDESMIKRLVYLIYDVYHDDAVLRKVARIPDEFDKLRKNYFNRREWSSLHVKSDNIETMILLQTLGFHAIYNKFLY